jgi:hypothetical protein
LLILQEEGRGLTSRKKLINIRSLTPQTNSYIKNLTLQGDLRSFKKVKEEKKIYHPTNVDHCDKMRHIAKNCPTRREEYKKRNKRHHAHTVEDEDPPTKMIKEQIEDYVLISALSGSMSPGEDTWLIDSGASKHMTGQRDTLSCLTEKNFPHKVTLGDDYQYPIKGVGESNYKLDSGSPMKMLITNAGIGYKCLMLLTHVALCVWCFCSMN